jgi:ribose-phosphate pyrophosphokinase
MNPTLLSGTSNLDLAKRVARELKLPLGDIEITRFIDNECRVYIKENVEGKTVVVIQSLSTIADQHLVELCLIGQALKSLKAKKVIAVIPWLGYSKQDKEFRKGEAISAQLVATFIEAAGFDAVISVELHSENVLPFFRIPVSEVRTEDLLLTALNWRPGLERAVVVCPDKGGKSRSERFAKSAGLPIAYLVKKRDLATGVVTVVNIEGDAHGKEVIIFDDIINTGATAIQTSQFLKGLGAKKIYFLATHAVLAGDASEMLGKSTIDGVIVTDTIAIPKKKQFSNLSIVSVASLLADAIKKL